MHNPISPTVLEVESLVREKLFVYGNAHLGHTSTWIASADSNEEYGYSVTVKIFHEDADPLHALLGPETGFEELADDTFRLAYLEDVEDAVSLLSLFFDFALAYTATEVTEVELSSLRSSGELFPWEVLSFRHYGDPRLDEVKDTNSWEGGDI